MGNKPPVMRKGKHFIRFNCDFGSNDDLKVNIVVKQKGLEEELKI